jgi:threonine dehydratase
MVPTLDAIREARERTESVVRHTPLVPLHERLGAPDIHLKLETFQPVGSFKQRGIFNAVAVLSDAERARGLSTVSAGNTAQALAWSARHFGVSARSVMPETAPQTKVDAVRALGGEPVLVPVADVFRYLKDNGWESEPYTFIHPWTNQNVLTGHGSLGLEILEDLEGVQSVFIPVGGGGLMAGVGSAIKAVRPDVRVVAVEPEGCPAFHESLRAGKPVEVACDTICDGVAVPYMTEEMFPLLKDIADATCLVSEANVKGMVRRLALDQKIVAEPSGALAVVAALQESPSKRGRSVAIVTGGSIDAEKLAAILSDETLPNFV